MQRCLGCMALYPDELTVCPNCGYLNSSPAKEAYHLTPGFVLQGHYIVGRTLGFGGFGVTYIGYDAQLERVVAIKEYLPSDFSTRALNEKALTVFPGELGEQFQAGLRSFIEEARRLAQFSDIPGIVHIYDSFEENNSGYIVMEYLDGRTIKEVLKADGIFSYQDTLALILPVLDALEPVHQAGIIHRDIAPDNIFITTNGDVRLIDFGASRYATTLHSKSLSVILKPGYAPEEQYRSKGMQGPWSDVYALAATMYKMLTGVTPEDAMDRKLKDELQEPSKLGSDIPKPAENALLNALNVNATDRTQNAQEFKEALLADEVIRNKVKAESHDAGKMPLWLKITSAVVAFAACLVLVLIATGVIDLRSGDLLGGYGGEVLAEGQINAPGVLNMNVEDAQAAVEAADLVFQIVGKEANENAPKDRVLVQNPEPGRPIEVGFLLNVIISAGPEGAVEHLVMPDLTYRTLEAATALLDAAGIKYRLEYEESETVQRGNIIRQSETAGTKLDEAQEIVVVVSNGSTFLDNAVARSGGSVAPTLPPAQPSTPRPEPEKPVEQPTNNTPDPTPTPTPATPIYHEGGWGENAPSGAFNVNVVETRQIAAVTETVYYYVTFSTGANQPGAGWQIVGGAGANTRWRSPTQGPSASVPAGATMVSSSVNVISEAYTQYRYSWYTPG